MPYKPVTSLFDHVQGLVSIKQEDVIKLLTEFTIMATRFKYKIALGSDANWCLPLSIDFDLFEHLQNHKPEYLAEIIITKQPANGKLFDAHWGALADDTAACLIADGNLAVSIMKLAEVG